MEWLIGIYLVLGMLWFAIGIGMSFEKDPDLKKIAARMLITGIVWPVWLLVGLIAMLVYLWQTADWKKPFDD